MGFTRLAIPEVILIEPKVHVDARGYFTETWRADRWPEGGVLGPFVQENQSGSKQGTLRGLHAQIKHPQGKLVRALRGEIWDVAVDVRLGSPTFGRHVWATLSSTNFRQLWIPPGFLHGFVVLSEEAEFSYKCTDFYAPGDELKVAWNDPQLAITWPLSTIILGEADKAAKTLAEQMDLLPHFNLQRS